MENRRQLLKKLAMLGLAAPLAGVFSGRRTTSARQPLNAQSDSALAGMSSRQLAGQRVVYSYPGLTPPDELLQLIVTGDVAGVIFFGENIDSHAQIAAVIQQLRAAQQQSPNTQPLLLMTDQEGGLVRRLPGEPELSEKQVGQSPDPEAAASHAGTGAGQNLAGVGMNVNLAPILGVFRQPGDFLDQFERSYSDDVQTVTICARAFIAAQQQLGVAATAKHFPGLGAATATENTDTGPVTLPLSLETLRDIDEAPYPEAIGTGVKLVMVSWGTYPALDELYPAGLSEAVIQGELRDRLGFNGVTITDAVEAGALDAFGSYGERAVLAARAGMDLLLCSARDVSQGQTVVAALAQALDSGQLNADDFNAAIQRISALRNDLASTRFFPETGYSVSHGFLAYWDHFGGLPVFGFPITDEDTDPQSGFVTQYFERARFEWHPGAWPARYDVELGLLGVELAQRDGLTGTTPFQAVQATADDHCTYFPETGHRLCYGFRDFWNAHGGLPIFGYPISEEFTDPATSFTVQYFERQRFEWHPENPPAWQVEGGLLGREILSGEA